MGKKLIKLPGENEVDLIVEDYQTALNGVAAWVRVGLRMVDVKHRAGTGNFTKWVDENLVQRAALKRRHLFQAKAVAEHLLNQHDCSPEYALEVIKDSKHLLWDDVLGKSTRQLSLEVRESNESEKELEAKKHCEEWWDNDPELRDEYEPRCLIQELSYVHALAGMTGSKVTKDSKRPATEAFAHLSKAAGSLSRHWTKYEELSPEQKKILVGKIVSAVEDAPDVVRRTILRKCNIDNDHE